MKKVININFQGRILPIEEMAYENLKNYIESLSAYFEKEEGKDEIINDIECRVAELCEDRLKKGAVCITEDDINLIIESIGRPADFEAQDGFEAQSSSGNSNFSSSSLIPQTYSNAVTPWAKIARVLSAVYSHYPSCSLETNYRVVVKNYQPSSIANYISNPYIISSIYKSILLNYEDPNKDFFSEFQHDEVASYIQQSEIV